MFQIVRLSHDFQRGRLRRTADAFLDDYKENIFSMISAYLLRVISITILFALNL